MKNPPDLSAGRAAVRAARDQRLARALRENLRRRKEQARAQADPGEDDAASSPALSGGAVSGTNHRRGGTTAD
jgi:hypothetical protein